MSWSILWALAQPFVVLVGSFVIGYGRAERWRWYRNILTVEAMMIAVNDGRADVGSAMTFLQIMTTYEELPLRELRRIPLPETH